MYRQQVTLFGPAFPGLAFSVVPYKTFDHS